MQRSRTPLTSDGCPPPFDEISFFHHLSHKVNLDSRRGEGEGDPRTNWRKRSLPACTWLLSNRTHVQGVSTITKPTQRSVVHVTPCIGYLCVPPSLTHTRTTQKKILNLYPWSTLGRSPRKVVFFFNAAKDLNVFNDSGNLRNQRAITLHVMVMLAASGTTEGEEISRSVLFIRLIDDCQIHFRKSIWDLPSPRGEACTKIHPETSEFQVKQKKSQVSLASFLSMFDHLSFFF